MGLGHRPSFDITSIELQNTPRPPSPAPTYCSTYHSEKDYSFPRHGNRSSSSSPDHTTYTWEDEKKPHTYPSEKSHPSFQNEKQQQPYDAEHLEGEFEVKPEPHDTNHPHYAAPSPPTTYTPPTTPASRPRQHIPALLKLLPWILAAVFFLTTLWFTSIALGVRFFTILQPTNNAPVNVYINGAPMSGAPAVSISTGVASKMATAPVPSKDPQDNTGAESLATQPFHPIKATSANASPSTLVTVTASATSQ